MSSTKAIPGPPAAAASTALLTLLAALTLCLLVLVMLAAPDAPFAPQWPWQWAAICAGVVATLAVALGLVWRERQIALCWYSIAMTAHAQAAELSPSPASDQEQGEAQQLVLAKTEEMVSAIGVLTELAETCTTALQQQRGLLQDINLSSKTKTTPLAAPTAAHAAPTRSAAYDPLTRALSHTTFMTRLRLDLAFAQQHQRSLALALFDINDFHLINDDFGYATGDTVLFAVAERIRTVLGEGDILARLSADCFAVVWPDMPALSAQAAVERIFHVVADHPLMIPSENVLKVSESLPVTLRAGLALCPDDGYTVTALMAIAKDALAAHLQPPRHTPDTESWGEHSDISANFSTEMTPMEPIMAVGIATIRAAPQASM